MNQTITISTTTLALQEPPGALFYEGSSGGVHFKVERMPWGQWKGYATFPIDGILVKTPESATPEGAAAALLMRVRDLHVVLSAYLKTF